MMRQHEVHAYDSDEGAAVTCFDCNWKRTLADVPRDLEGADRLIWLLDEKERHMEDTKERVA